MSLEIKVSELGLLSALLSKLSVYKEDNKKGYELDFKLKEEYSNYFAFNASQRGKDLLDAIVLKGSELELEIIIDSSIPKELAIFLCTNNIIISSGIFGITLLFALDIERIAGKDYKLGKTNNIYDVKKLYNLNNFVDYIFSAYKYNGDSNHKVIIEQLLLKLSARLNSLTTEYGTTLYSLKSIASNFGIPTKLITSSKDIAFLLEQMGYGELVSIQREYMCLRHLNQILKRILDNNLPIINNIILRVNNNTDTIELFSNSGAIRTTIDKLSRLSTTPFDLIEDLKTFKNLLQQKVDNSKYYLLDIDTIQGELKLFHKVYTGVEVSHDKDLFYEIWKSRNPGFINMTSSERSDIKRELFENYYLKFNRSYSHELFKKMRETLIKQRLNFINTINNSERLILPYKFENLSYSNYYLVSNKVNPYWLLGKISEIMNTQDELNYNIITYVNIMKNIEDDVVPVKEGSIIELKKVRTQALKPEFFNIVKTDEKFKKYQDIVSEVRNRYIRFLNI